MFSLIFPLSSYIYSSLDKYTYTLPSYTIAYGSAPNLWVIRGLPYPGILAIASVLKAFNVILDTAFLILYPVFPPLTLI